MFIFDFQCVAKNIEGWLNIYNSYFFIQPDLTNKLFLTIIATFSTSSCVEGFVVLNFSLWNLSKVVM